MIDAELLVVTNLKTDMPDQALEQERDIDTLGDLPVLIYRVTGTGQTSNGDGIWFVTFEFSAIAATADEALALAGDTYDFAKAWDDGNHITEYGWVAEITDSVYPSKDPSADIEGKTFQQYSGSLDLTLRSIT